jgi:hypothetical protein
MVVAWWCHGGGMVVAWWWHGGGMVLTWYWHDSYLVLSLLRLTGPLPLAQHLVLPHTRTAGEQGY